MATTYTPIATTTLSSPAGSIAFSSIPSTYTDIVAIVNGRCVTAAAYVTIFCRLNSDGGSNYSFTQIGGNGSTAYSDRVTNDSYCRLGTVAAGSTASGTFGNDIVNFQNYSNTTTYKTMLTRGNTAGSETNASVSLWRSTSAINAITFYCAGLANWDTGTTITLYGIKAA